MPDLYETSLERNGVKYGTITASREVSDRIQGELNNKEKVFGARGSTMDEILCSWWLHKWGKVVDEERIPDNGTWVYSAWICKRIGCRKYKITTKRYNDEKPTE